MTQKFSSSVLRDARRVVVKVGSSLVTNEGRGLDEQAIGEWCRQLAHLIRDGREVIMVSSGAIAEGMKRLGWAIRPKAVHELQAAAAVGQMGLAQMYETKLRANGLGSAQVLLTHADLADRVGADGLHLPEQALSAAYALSGRRPDWILTGAVHSVEAARAARDLDAVVLSPVFPAGGASADRPALGVEALAAVSTGQPRVIALGGVSAANAGELQGSGASGLAAIGGIAKAFAL